MNEMRGNVSTLALTQNVRQMTSMRCGIKQSMTRTSASATVGGMSQHMRMSSEQHSIHIRMNAIKKKTCASVHRFSFSLRLAAAGVFVHDIYDDGHNWARNEYVTPHLTNAITSLWPSRRLHEYN